MNDYIGFENKRLIESFIKRELYINEKEVISAALKALVAKQLEIQKQQNETSNEK